MGNICHVLRGDKRSIALLYFAKIKGCMHAA